MLKIVVMNGIPYCVYPSVPMTLWQIWANQQSLNEARTLEGAARTSAYSGSPKPLFFGASGNP